MNNKSEKLVSIIIPVYNAERHIKETIDSALNQSYKDCEIIVVDDGSTDQTPLILKQFKDSITVIRQENKGQGAARNNGFRHSKGQYVQFLDSDDVLFVSKIEKQINILSQTTNIGVVYSKTTFLYENEHGLLSKSDDTFTLIKSGKLINDLIFNNFIWMQSCLFRREVIEQVHGFDEDPRIIGVEDWDLLLRIANHDIIFGSVDEPLLFYRIHQTNFTALNKHKMRLGCIIALENLKYTANAKNSRSKSHAIRNAISSQRYAYAKLLFLDNKIKEARQHLFKGLRSFDTLWVIKWYGILLSSIYHRSKLIPYKLNKAEENIKRIKNVFKI